MKMKNIYLITLRDFDWDEFIGWVVVAENIPEALKICDIKKTREEAGNNQYEKNIEKIKQIGTTFETESKIILNSYNAG